MKADTLNIGHVAQSLPKQNVRPRRVPENLPLSLVTGPKARS